MYKRIRQRLDGNNEQGFTLIELLVVIIIIGILLAIAVPSYLGFRDRAANNASKANLRAALPAVEAYYADDTLGNGSYAAVSIPELRKVDQNVKLSSAAGAAATYCIASTVSGKTWHIAGPVNTDPVAGACP